MDNFDIIGAFKTYADSEEYHFLAGSKWHQNYEAGRVYYDNGALVLGVDFNCNPIYGKANQISEIRYEGVVMLGRKHDDNGKKSDITETFYQKYTRRLLDLMQGLDVVIREVACTNQLSITSARTTLDLNRFDTNIDFAVMQITLVQ